MKSKKAQESQSFIVKTVIWIVFIIAFFAVTVFFYKWVTNLR